MTNNITNNRILAISAIYEVALTVQELAWHGQQTQPSLCELLMPILKQEQRNESIITIYGHQSTLCRGLRAFQKSLQTYSNNDREINRYVFSLIHLAKKLNKNKNMLMYIARELDHIKDLTGIDLPSSDDDNFYAVHDAHIVRQLATIYQNSISKLGPRILINGKPEYLSEEKNVQIIRALLLSGIRSAILWHRLGGSRLSLWLTPNKYIKHTQDLLR